jgi:hypothetical protein
MNIRLIPYFATLLLSVLPTVMTAQGFSMQVGSPTFHPYNGTKMASGVTRLIGSDNGQVQIIDVFAMSYTTTTLQLPASATLGDVYGLSPNGRYVSATVNLGGTSRAVLWDLSQANPTPQLLPRTSVGTGGQAGLAVSNSGIVTGFDRNQAYVGTPGGTALLAQGPLNTSFAYGLVDVGPDSYVFGSAFNSSGDLLPSLWLNGVLSFLPGSGTSGFARGMSSDGRYVVGTLDGYMSWWDLTLGTQNFVVDALGNFVDGFFTSVLPSGLMAGNFAGGGSGVWFPGMSSILPTDQFFQTYLNRTLTYTPNETWALWDEGGGNFGMANIASGHLEVGLDPANTSVVPEPATITLLGTGLAAIGGAAARRRRSRLTS